MDLPDQLTFNRSGVPHFEGVLSAFDWNLSNCPVEINFKTCDSANYQALALLIPYAYRLKRQGCTVTFVHAFDYGAYNASRAWNMMGAGQLFAVSTDPTTNFKYSEHKPLFAIRNNDDFSAALNKLDEFTSEFGLGYERTLRYVLSELLYNTMEHGRSDFMWRQRRFPTPSILQCTWYEKMNQLQFLVADTGMGVRAHLAQAYSNIGSDQEALRMAVQPGVSGTFGSQDPYANKNNAGMGLYLSSNIIRRLQAEMHLVSGNAVLHVSPMDVTSRDLESNWPGTFVLLTVRVDRGNLIELDEVTHELRERARQEISERTESERTDRFYLNVFNFFGRYADDKAAAIRFRDKNLLPQIDAGKSILLDFSHVETSPHSFLNALLASPIKRLGISAYKKIRIVNATPAIRETIDYVLDDNTGEGATPEAYDKN